MPKAKGRTSVQVAVEELEVVAPSIEISETPIIEGPIFQSDLGLWWECLSGLVLAQGLLNIFLSWSKVWERSDIGVALLFTLGAVLVAVIKGRYAGNESNARKIFGFVCIGLGLLSGVAAVAFGTLPASSHWSYAAIGFTLVGWSLRRLLGESVVRCISLGLVAAFPLLFFKGDHFLGGIASSIQLFVESSTYWFIGVLADVYQFPYTAIVGGLKFASGEFRSAAAFGNVAGILVTLAVVLASAVIGRQSLVCCMLSALSAYLWWMLFRAGYVLSIASDKSLDGPLADLAMPLLALFGLILLTIATSIALSSILKVIPINAGQFDVSPLTLVYNAIVSFPQLGPFPVTLARAIAPVEPPSKDEIMLDEYIRAKEESHSLMDTASHSPSGE